MNPKAFVVVTHTFTATTQRDLVNYLDARYERVLYVSHDFSDCPTRKSLSEEHRKGSIVRTRISRDYRSLPEPIVILKDFLFAFFAILKTRQKWDVLIAVSGFDTLPGIFLKKLGFVSNTVFWAGDFVPNSRFESSWKNIVYLQVNRFVLRFCDYAWNISPRIEKLREKMYGIKTKRSQLVVTIGIWTNRRVKLPLDKIEKHRVLFIGHLLEKQGVQLVLDAIPKIVKSIPDFHFLVIGKGNYEAILKKKVAELEIGKYVTFTGFIKSTEEMEKLSSTCACAVAPYDAKTDTYTRYADPAKIKNYLASGLPVILTDVPYNAVEIHEKRCGIVVKYDKEALEKAIVWLLEDESRLEEYRKNAFEYSKRYDWNFIFDQAIGDVLRSGNSPSSGAI